MLIYLGILLFAAPHVFSMLMPAARDRMKANMGDGAYKGLYSGASLIGVALLVAGYHYSIADAENLYEPFSNLRHLMMLMVVLGFILIGASHGKGYIKSWVKHPMAIGIMLWSGGHLLVNGEWPVVMIFGMFFIVGLLDLVFSTARGKLPNHEPRLRSDIIAVLVGLVLTAIFALGFHPYVLGVPVAG